MRPPRTDIWVDRFCDMHVHLREAPVCREFAKLSAVYCDYFMAMPNTREPIRTKADVAEYHEAVCGGDLEDAVGQKACYTIMLTDETTPQIIRDVMEPRHSLDPRIVAAKLYPAGATTNSQHGVKRIYGLWSVFATMESLGLPLCVHAEKAYGDVLLRESRFLQDELRAIREEFPKLRIVVEHVTTRDGLNFVQEHANTFGTITAHHMLTTLTDLLGDGLRPDYYCKPVPKSASDMLALELVAGNNEKFFLGSDSAPHPDHKKYQDCGCAGCFTAPILPGLLAAALFGKYATQSAQPDDSLILQDIRNRMNNFCSIFPRKFYGLPPATGQILLEVEPQGRSIPTFWTIYQTRYQVFPSPVSLHWQLYARALETVGIAS